MAPQDVWSELTKAVAGRRVVADSHLDAHWWTLLASASDSSTVSRVEHAGLVLDELDATASEIAAARRFADQHCQSRHRAGPDALWLWSLLSRLEQLVTIRGAFAEAA